jgi:hypothetical protein
VYQPGKGLGFHFDKDEHVMRSSGVMLNPIWSSVLYLTGSTGPAAAAAAAAAADGEAGSGSSDGANVKKPCSCESDEGNAAAAADGDDEVCNDWDGVRQGEACNISRV